MVTRNYGTKIGAKFFFPMRLFWVIDLTQIIFFVLISYYDGAVILSTLRRCYKNVKNANFTRNYDPYFGRYQSERYKYIQKN